MNLLECTHTNSSCYKTSDFIEEKKGIIIHSTGANNPWLKRYVQPSPDNAKYEKLIGILGKNTNGNHWNRSINKAVHYMIGKDKNGEVTTAYTIPESLCCWGCGKGSKGSYNYNPNAHIQFEVLEDNLKDEIYFNKVYVEAAELCAHICKHNKLDPNTIVSHKEAHALKYASNHKDIDHWFSKYKKTMDDFRSDVRKVINGEPIGIASDYRRYSVVKGDSLWKIAKKYLGSGLRYTEIKKINGMKNNTIHPGQVIKLPVK